MRGRDVDMQDDPETAMRRPRVSFGDRHVPLPRRRWQRIAIGVALVSGGFLAFLPVLGLWMLPLGLLVLSVDLAVARRLRRKGEVRWGRWRQRRQERKQSGVAGGQGAGPL